MLDDEWVVTLEYDQSQKVETLLRRFPQEKVLGEWVVLL